MSRRFIAAALACASILFITLVMLATGPAFASASRVPIAAALALAGTPALAQDTTVGIGGWWTLLEPYLVTVIGAVVTAVLGWLAALVQRFVGIRIEKQHRDALHSAAMTGVAAALSRLGSKAADVRVDVRSQIVRDAIAWAERSVPDAIKALGATPDALAELAQSKLALLAEAPAAAKPGTP